MSAQLCMDPQLALPHTVRWRALCCKNRQRLPGAQSFQCTGTVLCKREQVVPLLCFAFYQIRMSSKPQHSVTQLYLCQGLSTHTSQAENSIACVQLNEVANVFKIAVVFEVLPVNTGTSMEVYS
jgi:hypothetical protein